jgi:hypothetical protein
MIAGDATDRTVPRTNQSGASLRRQKPYVWLCGLVALLSAGLLVYSQTKAMAWDEGFHLLAAQLIKAGKKPYLDFCFPQTPLNAYWNAGWMVIFGDSWYLLGGWLPPSLPPWQLV